MYFKYLYLDLYTITVFSLRNLNDWHKTNSLSKKKIIENVVEI